MFWFFPLFIIRIISLNNTTKQQGSQALYSCILLMYTLVIILFPFHPSKAGSFKSDQLQYSTVRTAYEEKLAIVDSIFNARGLRYPPAEVFLRIFKYERKIELWARSNENGEFTGIKDYSFSSYSGDLGPKRQQWDGQIPEGFYKINRFNPCSKFYLSVGIDYPNHSDRIKGVRSNLGGDIFIHGSDVTIGCIPIYDSYIKELYIILVDVHDNGQKNVPVHIFPFRMNTNNIRQFADYYPEHVDFWKNLKPIYDYFEENRVMPEITVTSSGKYLIPER